MPRGPGGKKGGKIPKAGLGAAKKAALQKLQGRREIGMLKMNLSPGFIEAHADEILEGLKNCRSPIDTLEYIQALKRRERGK